ncbi:MAG TPA: hypothetical protein VMV45_17030 [Casimicrobiaceae bacterium]|nr:hypothetical protein [Casimicrobiaceae bacterium]
MNKTRLTTFKRRAAAAAPYLIALALPGGSLVAAALWLYRARQRGA